MIFIFREQKKNAAIVRVVEYINFETSLMNEIVPA